MSAEIRKLESTSTIQLFNLEFLQNTGMIINLDILVSLVNN